MGVTDTKQRGRPSARPAPPVEWWHKFTTARLRRGNDTSGTFYAFGCDIWRSSIVLHEIWASYVYEDARGHSWGTLRSSVTSMTLSVTLLRRVDRRGRARADPDKQLPLRACILSSRTGCQRMLSIYICPFALLKLQNCETNTSRGFAARLLSEQTEPSRFERTGFVLIRLCMNNHTVFNPYELAFFDIRNSWLVSNVVLTARQPDEVTLKPGLSAPPQAPETQKIPNSPTPDFSTHLQSTAIPARMVVFKSAKRHELILPPRVYPSAFFG
ncbi:hypothetical protein BDY17DRAFT_111366 [Neohortaea acidophila]|uniref:Uncharacterized protein n=1 Tax=Neohortaea acidophila TaxID=245834 RepID=A0A6A6PZX9_9PEZI|nr:uncharacterized protein BDY17DRAFT_111366 [Neohortaea acidophila]KAF2485768.1 hypothetical protein BDY17DRAFT_111366 [Neohortaea acidophila]